MLTGTDKAKGFTLIELMLAISILGILASIAVPAYIDYVREADRSIAKTDLHEIAHVMEREFTVNRTYRDDVSTPNGAGLYNYTVSLMGAGINYHITASITGSRDNLMLRLDGVGREQVSSDGGSTFYDGWPD